MALTDADREKVRLLLEGPDGPILSSYIDSRVLQGVKSHDAKIVSYPRARERLERIEKAMDEKVKALEIKTHALRECQRRGLSFDVVEDLSLSFADEDDVSKKLDALQAVAKASQLEDLNARMASSYRPGSAGQREPSEPFKGYAQLNAQEKLAAQFNNSLNKT